MALFTPRSHSFLDDAGDGGGRRDDHDQVDRFGDGRAGWGTP